MLGFGKEANAFSNLAKAFNGAYVYLNAVEEDMNSYMPNIFQQTEAMHMAAYICRKGILDSSEVWDWKVHHKIIVPMISKKRITVGYAHEQTVARIFLLSTKMDLDYAVHDIMNKGQLYHRIDSSLPESEKKHFRNYKSD